MSVEPPVLKLEAAQETCCVCGVEGELLSPEEHDAAAAEPVQAPLRAMLLHLNNNKVVPEGRLCLNCIRRTIDAYEFSTALSLKGVPPLSEKIRALRRRLHELTQKIDVFIVVGGPGMNGGTYSEEDIIMVERDVLAAATAADDEDLEKAKNARGDTVYQCSVCPLSFQRVAEYREHSATHASGAAHACWQCGAQFATRAALREHRAAHAPSDARICHLCNTSFQTAMEQRRHGAACAGSGLCPACGAAVAGGRAALAAHMLALHGAHAPHPPHVCASCFAPFPSGAALSAHALSHRQAEHYVCGYDGCILRFASRSNLLAHIRKCHAAAAPAAPPPAAPPLACAHCERTFASSAALKRHSRVHRTHTQELEPMETADGDVEYLEMEALDDYSHLGHDDH